MTDAATHARRRYDSPLRQAQAAETRERILTAGADLVRESSLRDWRGITIRAVAARAGVNERTVYRHFANERALRDAVMAQLEAAAGIDLERMTLDDVADVAARIAELVATAPPARTRPTDPTLSDANRRQHDALVAAVTDASHRWPSADRRLAAALFDVLWSVSAYERLIVDWELDQDEAIRGITWLIDLLGDTIRAGRRPPRR